MQNTPSSLATRAENLLDDNVIRGSVQWQPKNPDRIKMHKQMINGNHAAEYAHVDSVFRVLKDLAGTRITAYLETDRPNTVNLVQKRFGGFGYDRAVCPTEGIPGPRSVKVPGCANGRA